MNLAPIQPAKFFVGHLSVKPNPAYQPLSDWQPLPLVNLNINLGRIQGPPSFQCTLIVKSPVSPEEPAADPPAPSVAAFPYDVEVEVVGIFGFLGDVNLDERAMERMAAYNGTAMLYGFARDVILQATTLGPHGPFMLPSQNLASVAEQLLAGWTERVPDESDGPSNSPNGEIP